MFVCRPRRRHAHAPVGTPPGYLVGRGSHEESLRCRFRRRCVRARKEQRRESRPKWMTTPPVGALYPEINSMLNLCPMDRRARSFIHFRSLACAPNFLAARPPSDPEPDFAPKTHFSNKSPRFLPSARFDSSKQISPASFFFFFSSSPTPPHREIGRKFQLLISKLLCVHVSGRREASLTVITVCKKQTLK